MIDSLIDRIDSVLERIRIPLGIAGAVWFALTCAQHAGFVRLPDFSLLHGTPSLVFSVIYNAVYWGFIWPRVEARRGASQAALKCG